MGILIWICVHHLLSQLQLLSSMSLMSNYLSKRHFSVFCSQERFLFESPVCVCVYVCVGNGTQILVHSEQALYHWTAPQLLGHFKFCESQIKWSFPSLQKCTFTLPPLFPCSCDEQWYFHSTQSDGTRNPAVSSSAPFFTHFLHRIRLWNQKFKFEQLNLNFNCCKSSKSHINLPEFFFFFNLNT